MILNVLQRSVVFFLLTSFCTAPALAKIYYSKKEAMVLAFGEGAVVEQQALFPTEEQKKQIQKLAGIKVETSFFTFYVGKKDGMILGYAAIESHKVRTKPETVLLVLTTDGNLRAMHVLAFHEPPDYQPPDRWYAQLYNKKIAQISFNRDVQAMTGATISTRAAMQSARKVLAIFQVMMQEN